MSNPNNGLIFGSNIDDDGVAAGLPEVKMEPAVVREPPKKAALKKAPRSETHVRIILEDNDQIPPSGQFFGAQGIGYILKPNMPADVPLAIVDILNSAIMSVPVVNSETMQVTGFKDRLRFPYRVVATLPPEQVVEAA